MNATKVRRQLKKQIDRLSPEQLTLVVDFLEDLEIDDDHIDATEELLNIPNFGVSFAKANQEVNEGKVKDWRMIRNDV